VLNAGVQFWSVQVVHAADCPPVHSDAQCCAPHETTVPQQVAQALVSGGSLASRQVATQLESPVQFWVR